MNYSSTQYLLLVKGEKLNKKNLLILEYEADCYNFVSAHTPYRN